MVAKKTKILITGGAGYIGSHTIKELQKAGYDNLTVVDDLSAGYAERVPENVKFIKGDFADKKILEKIFKEEYGAVIHFAASKIAPESVTDPGKYYENNVAKSIEFLNKCVDRGVKDFIFSSSAAVYGDVSDFPITEEFVTQPTNPYGWSKLMFEQVLADFAAAGKINYVALRYFNVGGADPETELGNNHQKGEDVISVLMRAAKSGKTFTIFGNNYDTKDGSGVRDMIHVSDLAAAHLKALEYLDKDGGSTAVNLGSEAGFTVFEMAEIAKKVTGSSFEIVWGPRRDGDIAISVASSGKARTLLGWERKYSDIETIIRTAWEWERKTTTAKKYLLFCDIIFQG